VLNLHYPQSKRNSQCGKIFAIILARYPDRVPLYEIFPLAKQYNARLWTLRRWLWPRGFDIRCEEEWVDGQCHTWYRLVSSPAPSALGPAKEKTPPADSAASKSNDWYAAQTGKPRSSGDTSDLPLFAVRS
jgi:hypothetical protein